MIKNIKNILYVLYAFYNTQDILQISGDFSMLVNCRMHRTITRGLIHKCKQFLRMNKIKILTILNFN